MKKVSSVVFTIAAILATFAFAYGMRFEGSYSGKVIDAETGAPIEGAVVLGVWYTVIASAGGALHNFHDAKETLTDRNGEFRISGKGVKTLINVSPMEVMIFKAGYEHLELVLWDSLKEDRILRKKIKWEGKKAIIPLKKLTMEERRKRLGTYFVDIPEEKQKQLIKETKKEDAEIGR